MAKLEKIKFLSDLEVPKLTINNTMYVSEKPATNRANKLLFVIENYDCTTYGHIMPYAYGIEWDTGSKSVYITGECQMCNKSLSINKTLTDDLLVWVKEPTCQEDGEYYYRLPINTDGEMTDDGELYHWYDTTKEYLDSRDDGLVLEVPASEEYHSYETVFVQARQDLIPAGMESGKDGWPYNYCKMDVCKYCDDIDTTSFVGHPALSIWEHDDGEGDADYYCEDCQYSETI